MLLPRIAYNSRTTVITDVKGMNTARSKFAFNSVISETNQTPSEIGQHDYFLEVIKCHNYEIEESERPTTPLQRAV